MLGQAYAAAESAQRQQAKQAADSGGGGVGARVALLSPVLSAWGNASWSLASLVQRPSTRELQSGGEPCDAACREWLLRRAVSVHLDVPWEPGLGLQEAAVVAAVEAAARVVAASGT